MRYEHNTERLLAKHGARRRSVAAGRSASGPAAQGHSEQNDDVDLFSGHGITQTRITDNFWFTAGYSYTTITNDLSGSRIFGTHWDEAFGEPVPTLG